MLIIAGGHMVLLCIGFSYGCPGLVASRAGHEGPSVYFVDSRSGKDENEGRSGDKPWKSLLKLEGIGLGPGDSIRFKRGSEFTGTVYKWFRDKGPVHYPDRLRGPRAASAGIYQPVF